jgi:GNAT superfamily N-acetyltransferase
MCLPAGYSIQEGTNQIDFVLVHSWLTVSYWSPGVSLEQVQKAAANSSLVVNVLKGRSQVGYLRVVSDRTTFAWLCDVWVDEAHRGKGIAKAMVRYATAHPDHQGLRRWILATRDAHAIYNACGFTRLPEPERWMVKALNG